ncbi:MAG: ABC transporter substrate-binding protein [Bdellovibrionales bacterium]
MVSYFKLLFLLSLIVAAPFAYASEKGDEHDAPLSFYLLNPDSGKSNFWKLFEVGMADACNDLGCHLIIKDSARDQHLMLEQIRDITRIRPKPDAVFFQSLKSNGPEAIKTLDRAGINHFMLNAGLTSEQSAIMGQPREQYKFWLGQMIPDDFEAGRLTAEALYREAKKQGKTENGKVRLLAIEGNRIDGASMLRVQGLNHFVDSRDDVELLQIVQGKWNKIVAKRIAERFFMRYPDVDVYWTASDGMANGVLEACEEAYGTCDKLIVGTDWEDATLDHIHKGKILGSTGGHFMEGAWAATLMYDYINGHDFAEKHGVNIKSKMSLLDQSNAAEFRQKCCKQGFKDLNFQMYSVTHQGRDVHNTFDVLDLFSIGIPNTGSQLYAE